MNRFNVVVSYETDMFLMFGANIEGDITSAANKLKAKRVNSGIKNSKRFVVWGFNSESCVRSFITQLQSVQSKHECPINCKEEVVAGVQ